MNTEQILKLACDMAGFYKMKGESKIFLPGEDIKRVLVGIDIYPNDLIQAKEDGFDLVLSHHPPDKNFTEAFCEEIDDQIPFLVSIGVDEDEARLIVEPIRNKYYSWNKGKNHQKVTDLAKRLNIPLMNIHQPCDELGRRYLQEIADKMGDSATVEELMDCFSQVDEMQHGDERVELVCGELSKRIGRTSWVR